MSQEKKVYSFKGVGQTVEEASAAQTPSPFKDMPIGILTPVRPATINGTLFEMSTDFATQIKDNFKNMISTNHGERLMLSDFGGNLKPLAYELGTDAADAEAVSRISRTTQKYMPYVTLETFESIRENSSNGNLSRVGVRITYSVPVFGISEASVEALIHSAG